MSPSDPSPSDSFSVRTERRGDTVVVRAFGELDLSVAERFEEEVRAALTDEASKVLIDLSEVWFIDSTGLRVLVMASEAAQQADKELGVWGEVSPAVERAFGVTGLGERLPFDSGPLP